MGEPKLAALIFYSGKIVFTGAKNEYEIKKAYNYLLTVLQKHKQPPTGWILKYQSFQFLYIIKMSRVI